MNAILILTVLAFSSRFFTLSYSRSGLSIEKVRNYYLLKLGDLPLYGKRGYPFLPVDQVLVAIGEDEEVLDVDIISYEAETLRDVIPPPAPKPVPLISEKTSVDFPSPNRSIYDGSSPYPHCFLELKHQGHLFGQKVAVLAVYPVRYLPQLRSVVFLKRIDFKLRTRKVTGKKPRVKFANLLRQVVLNPEDVKDEKDEPVLEYVVITSEALAPGFESLLEWKRRKGIFAELRTVEWISANYPGRDLQEKIRNYLKVAADSGLSWVLLGGDVSIVPHRIAFAMPSDAGFGGYADSIPCDLYYSDLDGTWDLNNNGIFGELEDSVDLLPDLLVGRAPVESSDEVATFVQKLLQYEVTISADYVKKALFAASYLDENTDGSVTKELINEEMPIGFTVSKLYERDGDLNSYIFLDSLNAGFNLVNHVGHGGYRYLSTGFDGIFADEFDDLENWPRITAVFYSEGCFTAGFDDDDCIGEHFVLAPSGGGFYIGNSRFGWYTPYFAGCGSSDLFDREFFHWIFGGVSSAGEALALTKASFAAYAYDENDYRWNIYTLNLLGDPEMPLYLETPESLEVAAPDTVTAGDISLPVAVFSSNGLIAGARVSITYSGQLLARGITDASGSTFLNVSPAGLDSVLLTVSRRNFWAASKWIYITEDLYVSPESLFVWDSGDGVLNPGEEAEIQIRLRNHGSETLTSLEIYLSSEDERVVVLDTAEVVGNLPPGEVVEVAFSVAADSSLNDRDAVLLDITAVSDQGVWHHTVSIVIGAPVLNLVGVGQPPLQPGESGIITLKVSNSGLGRAESPRVVVSSCDSWIIPEADTVGFSPLDSGETTEVEVPISVSNSCPAPTMSHLFLTWGSGEFLSHDTVTLAIGWSSFYDGVESGNAGWTVDGGLWHITNYRAASGFHSWYCGDEETHNYPANALARLISPPFIAPPGAFLRFMTYYELHSGWDYGVVEVWRGEEHYPLGLITGRSNGFVERVYDLSFSEPGETIRICFTMETHSTVPETLEGWFIDDVEVTTAYDVSEGSKAAELEGLIVYPNPSNGVFKFELRGDRPAQAVLQIYDVTGRLIREIRTRGSKSLKWDGLMTNGARARCGVYFYILRAGPKLFKGKLLFLRG